MIAALLATLGLAAGLVAGSPASQEPDTSLIVTARWLAAHRGDPSVVVLQVDRGDSAYRAAHIGGARFVGYADLAPEVNGLVAELPGPETIRQVLEAAGVSDDSRVILTGPPLMATRAFFTLDYFGLRRVSILAGGLPAWRAVGGAVETGTGPAAPVGRLTARVRPVVANAEYVLDHIGRRGVALVDTRTAQEYNGTAMRGGVPVQGHIEGARRLEWEDLFTDPNEFTPKDTAELRRMWSGLAAPGDSVVAYCQSGVRASGSYFFARYLGYPVLLYDGSYQEWSRRGLPLVKAATPPL